MSSPQTTFDDALACAREVPGWMTDAQARRLWDRALALGENDRIVEIGSFQGRSTVLFGKAAHPGVEVVAIDPHGSSIRSFEVVDGHEHEAEAYHKAFVENLERYGVADRIHYIRKSSHAALWDVDGAVELLYIDGSHNFGPARADMREWGSRLAVGSTMLIHDSFTSVGVTLAILATLVGSRRFSYVGRVGSLAEFRREDLRGRARWRGATALLSQLPYFGRNLVVEVLLILRLRGLTRYLGYDTSLDWPH